MLGRVSDRPPHGAGAPSPDPIMTPAARPTPVPASLSDEAARLDAADPLADRRALFDLPPGVVYLDGNSLGPVTRSARERVVRLIDAEWGRDLVSGWTLHGWIDLPTRVGARIGALVGAEEGSVIAADSTTVNVFKLVAAALALVPDRRVILTDSGNFPTDVYAADGLAGLMGRGHEIRVVAPEAVEAAIDETVALVLLTEVDYRTGRLHAMDRITAAAHRAGALTLWDLAHSAGALQVNLAGARADFAVGCGYKYLNGGPGAPAFLYVAPRHQDRLVAPLAGWMGHAAPFAFDLDYRPAPGIDRLRVGTPPILSLAALDGALDAFDGIDMQAVRAKSVALCDLFIAAVEATCPDLALASPRDGASRGSQVSFRHPEGYAVMQALIARGVVGDFRAPDIVRFGFTPLTLAYRDVLRAAAVIEEVLRLRLFDDPRYRTRAKVT
jgi:kynureninase